MRNARPVVLLACILCSFLFADAQGEFPPIATTHIRNEVGVLDLRGSARPLPKVDEGVAASYTLCGPEHTAGDFTLYAALDSVSKTTIRTGEWFDFEVIVLNMCHAPVDVPWSPEAVTLHDARVPKARLTIELYVGDVDDLDLESPEEVHVYKDPDDARTFRTLYQGDYVRYRARARIVRKKGKPCRAGSREVEIESYVSLADYNGRFAGRRSTMRPYDAKRIIVSLVDSQ